MRTIAQEVERILSSSPLLTEVMQEDIANVSSVARYIKPKIQKRVLGKVSEEAVAMALHRAKRRMKPAVYGSRFVKNLKNITVSSNLTEFIFPDTPDTIKIHQEILKITQGEKDLFFNISRGLFESVIFISSEYEKNIEKILNSQKEVTKIKDLSSVTIKLSTETINSPGVYYLILKSLAWEGVNIIEIISTGSELSMIFKNHEIDRAFSVVKSLAS